MPGFFDSLPLDGSDAPLFSVISQRVDLEVDFASRSLTGSTQIVAQPLTKDLKAFRFNCRQCRITRATIEGKPAPITYSDPYDKIRMRRGMSTIHHHDYLRSKLAPQLKDPAEPELALALPPRVTIKELEGEAVQAFQRDGSLQRKESDAFGTAETPTGQTAQDQGPKFAPLKIYIEFQVSNFRDGIQLVGFEDDDLRYPHMYTKNSLAPGNTCSLFPCLDNANSRCTWEISFRCPKTLGDAFRIKAPTDGTLQSDGDAPQDSSDSSDNFALKLSTEEKSLELSVICSGEMTDDNVDPADPSQRTISFSCTTPVAARHIGFAIGPFEYVDLSAEFRQADEDEKLGQNAVKVHGFCLPGRSDDLRNTCMPMPKAIDYFTVNYGSYPFSSYKLCFVDDLPQAFTDTAGLSICNTRLLFPEDVIDPLDANTRVIVHALASQYSGVNVVPREALDMWTITGIAGFMTDIFMKKLAGNNEYRFRQKLASDKVFELDVGRYSLHQLGGQLDIDPSEFEFLNLKSALVLFILNNRLTKASGSSGLSRIITRIFLQAKTGDLYNGELSTEYFLRTCEKLGHTKLDGFFKQWVYGAGCPDFQITEQFNKKKLVVELRIEQKQVTRDINPPLNPSTFLREAKEQMSEAWVPPVQPVFTGPMTIRIHEADGTPYEHIVEIKEAKTKFEIPYNTKYKRLKRSKKAKERAIAQNGPEQVGESHDDVLLYCLGDTLQTDEDVKEWAISDWDETQERQMGEESYEWIRMDADFEWIGRIHSTSMPIWMYVSQLQQDRDVVAQYQSLQRIYLQPPHPLASTFLVRTLMDRRYFHGIRTFAATALAKQAVAPLNYIGMYHLQKAFHELFCFPGTTMPRANDFSDRATYLVQCAIPKALARVRDPQGRSPIAMRKFFIDKIKFNDNSSNEFSDCFYISMLLECLSEAIAASTIPKKTYSFNFDNDEEPDEEQLEEEKVKTEAMSELERYRRFDEWISSYQNTYTTSAIACLERLIESGAVANRAADILQYTRPGNAENVRIRAYTALVKLKIARKPQILKFILHNLADDSSPHMRAQLLQVFGQALGSIAIGDDQAKDAQITEMDVDSELVLDQGASAETRQLEIARKNSPEGALSALKLTMGEDEVLKSSLWQAVLSPKLSISELVGLLDVAALLYDPSSVRESLIVTLPLPRAYHAQNQGKGKVRFYQTHIVRTKPSRYTPLSAADYKLVQDHGLKYTGPFVKSQVEREPLPKINTSQKMDEIKVARPNVSSTHMSPPPLPTPSEGSLKLSLKRKQSVDAGRAGSPKAPKIAKALAGTTHARSPSVVPQQPSTPVIKVGKKLDKVKSKLVKMRIGRVAAQVQAILSKPSKNGSSPSISRRQSQTPVSQNDGYFPPQSPHQSNGSFPSPNAAQTGWNMGGFRNYSAAPSQSPAPIKTEEADTSFSSAVSPMSSVPPVPAKQSTTTNNTNGAPSEEKAKPARKLTLKLGMKKSTSSAQGSPT